MSDSSGMIFYHTPNKRTSNAAYTIWGALTLELPPGKENILQTGGCPAECTNDFNEETVYISQIFPHMHYLGTSLFMTQGLIHYAHFTLALLIFAGISSCTPYEKLAHTLPFCNLLVLEYVNNI